MSTKVAELANVLKDIDTNLTKASSLLADLSREGDFSTAARFIEEMMDQHHFQSLTQAEVHFRKRTEELVKSILTTRSVLFVVEMESVRPEIREWRSYLRHNSMVMAIKVLRELIPELSLYEAKSVAEYYVDNPQPTNEDPK